MSEPSFGTEPHKLVRRDGLDTSINAACKVDTSHWERLVYQAVLDAGQHGVISDDVRAAFPQAPYSTITARFAALKAKGLIVDTGQRRAGRSGRSQAVLVAAKVQGNA